MVALEDSHDRAVRRRLRCIMRAGTTAALRRVNTHTFRSSHLMVVAANVPAAMQDSVMDPMMMAVSGL
jgi:hypothetical protein